MVALLILLSILLCTNNKTHVMKTFMPLFFVMILLFQSAHIRAQIGRVGINTLTPQAMLHVKDSSVVFTGVGAASATPGNPPVSGQGRRMMWYADKAAFRVGYVPTTQWDKDNVGNYSFAAGQSTTASGYASFATGVGAEADGDYSLAHGSVPTRFSLLEMV